METKLSDKWTTPEWLIDLFKGYYDPCPLNPIEDGLNTNWKDYTYVNPPYSEPLKWVLKAIKENKKGKTIVLLLKLDSSTRWYRELINANAHILLFNERLHYSDSNPAKFPSMLAILSAPAKPDGADSKNRSETIGNNLTRSYCSKCGIILIDYIDKNYKPDKSSEVKNGKENREQ